MVLTSVGIMRISGIVLVFALLAAAGSARADAPKRETVFVTITPTLCDAERTAHAETIRRAVAPAIAAVDRHADINITQLTLTEVDGRIEIVAELGFVLSTSQDHIVSFGNQTAKLTLPKSRVTSASLPALRREAIQSALEDLVRRLRRTA